MKKKVKNAVVMFLSFILAGCGEKQQDSKQSPSVSASQETEQELAELTAFPVYVGLPDVNVVETREDFLELGADTVFTQVLQKSVENAEIDNFQPSMAGFSISDGGTANINFGVVDGALAINGINY